MTDCLEGNGYLLRGDHLVTRVRYRLRWSVDGWGRSRAEGEIQPSTRLSRAALEPFLMLTEEGLSVPLEVTGGDRKGWLPFRRVNERELADAMA